MTSRITALSALALFTASSALAQTVTSSVFATGSAVGATAPDSITAGIVNGQSTVWVEYGNGADSTGAMGNSTIVEYSPSGTVKNTYSIPGLVDGMKVDPFGKVWVLQNNDGNSTLTLINTNGKMSGPFSYQAPPYVYGPYGPSGGRGYDDVAFLNGKVYLSYTNPMNPADPVLQILDQGNKPTSGPLTTSSILNATQTNPLYTSSSQAPPDIDSLKSTPSGQLVLTSEGDKGAGPTSDGRFTLISNPGPGQTITNVRVTNAGGTNVLGMDDVLFPGASSGTLYVADTGTNTVWAVHVTGLNPDIPIASLGSFNEVALVNPTTGVVAMPLLSGLQSPHGMDFVVPEPSTWAMLLLSLAALVAGAARRLSAAA
jgi:hypothetical protein